MRVIDERKTRAAQEHPEAVKKRPFAIQVKTGRKWGTIPGATYATRDEANDAKQRRAENLAK